VTCRCNAHESFNRIVADVSRVTGVHRLNIVGKSRTASTVCARQAVWWLMRVVSNASYPEIGRLTRRDHTTVLAGVRRADRPEVMAIINAVLELDAAFYGSAEREQAA